MNFLSITVILNSLLIIQEFQSIDGSVEQIYEKVKQEVEDLIDSQDYGSVDNIVKDSKVKVKYFDYLGGATSPKPIEPTTEPITEPPVKDNKAMTRDGHKSEAAFDQQSRANQEEEGGVSVVIYVVVLVVVVIVVGGGIGVFCLVRQSKTTQKNKNIKGKKMKRNASRESLASIETVASDTGKPIHPKPGPGQGSTSASKPVSKKK